MDGIHSAGDMMRAMGMPKKPVDYIAGKVISRTFLSGSTKYSYCPFCYQRIKRAGLDFKTELRPLQVVTYRNLYRVGSDGTCKILPFEKEWQCTVCKNRDGTPRVITLDDFVQAYAAPYREEASLYLNANDKDALRRAGFGEFADCL